MKNTKETKKTILEEALLDFNELLREADKSAREKIIKSMPDKFDEILSEEIKKITNKSDKEPIVEGKKKELVDNKKSEKKINEEVDLTTESMDTVEDVYDNANKEDEFTVENDEYGDFNFDELEQELAGLDAGGIDDHSDVVPDMAETDQVTDPYQKFRMLYEKMGEIVTEMEKSQNESMYEAEFNGHITEMFGDNHNLSEDVVNNLYEEFKARKEGDPFEDKKLTENESEPFDNPDKKHGETDPFDETDKKNIAEADESDPFGEKQGKTPNVSEMKESGGMSGPDMNKGNENEAGGPTQATINEEETLTEAADPTALEIIAGTLGVLGGAGGITALMQYLKNKHPQIHDAVAKAASGARQGVDKGPNPFQEGEEKHDEEGEEKEPIDEIHGQSFSAGKVRAGTLPNDGQQYRNREGHKRTRAEWGEMAESLNKKVKTLLEDKKKMSKKINEQRGIVTKLEKINEQYKEGMGKYRTHLQEMAVFNTNLAHVNNILVESVEDKENVKQIINKFKTITNIDESKKTFKEVIAEMKGTNKEVIKEEVEEKLNKEMIGESSSPNGDKSKVITESAFKTDAHLNKLKGLINYKISK